MTVEELGQPPMTGGAAVARPGMPADVADRADFLGGHGLDQDRLGHLEAAANQPLRTVVTARRISGVHRPDHIG